jgi:copper homeostasis protein
MAAQAGGATRIELCSNLLEGGTTPSSGLLGMVRQQLHIPIHVLVRPRGGDFCYDQLELEVMRRDISAAKALGADGIVLGLLRPDGSIDSGAARELIELARPLKITWHRAFDMATDPLSALEEVIALGADILLTSGQQPTALAGKELITKLHRQSAGRINLMPGGGVNADNLLELALSTGCRQFHSSARRQYPGRMQFQRVGLHMGGWKQGEFCYSRVDESKVRRMVEQLAALP